MCDLNAMTRHYGPATWFLTFSPSEWMDTELLLYLRKINNHINTSKMNVKQFTAMDPVFTAIFMEIKFKGVLAFTLSSDNPIGKVKHYFWRREYQQRGMVHFHLMVWIENAPFLGQASDLEVAKFIQ